MKNVYIIMQCSNYCVIVLIKGKPTEMRKNATILILLLLALRFMKTLSIEWRFGGRFQQGGGKVQLSPIKCMWCVTPRTRQREKAFAQILN